MTAPDWLMTITSLLVGYALGKGTITKESIMEAEKIVYKSVDNKLHPPGVVNRPSAAKVNLWANPKKEEEEKAMSDSLKRDLGEPK